MGKRLTSITQQHSTRGRRLYLPMLTFYPTGSTHGLSIFHKVHVHFLKAPSPIRKPVAIRQLNTSRASQTAKLTPSAQRQQLGAMKGREQPGLFKESNKLWKETSQKRTERVKLLPSLSARSRLAGLICRVQDPQSPVHTARSLQAR